MAAAVRLVQLTDCHLTASPDGLVKGCETQQSLDAVVAAALEAGGPRPDAVLATGDIAQDGSRAAYQRFRRRLSDTGLPVMCIPGNHDDPATLADVCSGGDFSVGGSATIGAWQLVLLSTWDGDRGGGRLSAGEIARLEETLARTTGPHVLVVIHHHPVPIGSAWLDSVALDNGPELLRLVDGHPRVRGLLWGHVHQAHDSRRNDMRLMGSPSTCFQFRPGTDVPEVDTAPPAWRTLELHADGEIRTRVEWLRGAT
ncbi:MAG: metallophosphoesterase [Gammaproteobacteria bacterium]